MRAGPLITATLAAGLLLAGCGGGDDAATSAPASAPASTTATVGAGAGAGETAATGSLSFPEGFGLPDLPVPDDARVVDYAVGDAQNFEVVGVDQAAVLDSLQQQLETAGFQVDRSAGGGLGTSITASLAGAGTVLVSTSGSDGVTVIGNPPA